MRQTKVREIMRPLAECATVMRDALFIDAAQALEASCALNGSGPLLVVTDKGEVAGIFGPLNFFQGLEPRYFHEDVFSGLKDYAFYGEFTRDTLSSLGLFDEPMEHLCAKAAKRSVGEFLPPITEDQRIDQESSLDVAIHQFCMSRHQALLVTGPDGPVGLIKLSDLFCSVLHTAQECLL